MLSCANYCREPTEAGGLDMMTSRDTFQALQFYDSVVGVKNTPLPERSYTLNPTKSSKCFLANACVWKLLNRGLNLWLITWGEHWVSCGSTGEGNSPVWPEEVVLDPPFLDPHLRADWQWGRILFWRLLFVEFFLRAYDTSKYFFSISN